ncbi:MAG: hypothetical protein J07HX5_00007 [halophilic archaeon J07HX5]|nr:MAG: hypothetical protein J07HX5_00007 [halophilic archaeon J07HX5]
MQKMVFPAREFAAGTTRPFRWAVFSFSLVFFTGEVVSVLFQPVAGVQFTWAVLAVDSQVVTDSEVDFSNVFAGCIFNGNFLLTYQMQFPSVAVPDGTRLLDVLDGHIWPYLVFHENEVWPAIFAVPAF